MAERALSAVAASGGAVTVTAQLLRAALMMTSTIVLGRLVTPSAFGLIAMVVAVTGIAEIFRDFGLSMAALRARDLTQHQKSNLFWLNSAVGLALAAIVFALSWPLAAFYETPELVTIVQGLSPTYLLGGLAAQFRVSINRELRFRALAVCDLLPLAIAIVVAVLLAAQGYGVLALVAQLLVTSVLTLAIAALLAKWRPGLPRRGQNMWPLISFGLNFAATQLLAYATRNADSIAIGRVWGTAPLGQYDRAFQFAVAPVNQINVPMSRVAIPVLARVRDDVTRYTRALREAQLIACYVTSSALLLLGGVGVPLVELLLGPGWGQAGQILSVLAVGSMFRAIQQIAYWIFMSAGRADAQLRLHLVGQPIIIALLLLGLPWGPVGVAAGSTVGYMVFWAMSLIWASRVASQAAGPLFLTAARAILTFGAPAAVIAFVLATVVDQSAFIKVTLGVGGAAAWYLVAWTMSRSIRRDISILFGFVRLAARRGQ